MKINLLLHALFLVLLLTARIISAPTANISYLVLAAYALFGRAHAIRALGISWLFTMLSPGIGPEEVSFSSVGRYLILATAAISVFFRNSVSELGLNFKISKSILFSIAVGFFFVIHAIFVSPIPDVSILKALTWTAAFTILLSAWNGMSATERRRTEWQIFYALILLMLISLPLLGMNLGYLRNGVGFQGVLNHPQAFGPVMALLAAWLGSQILARVRSPLYLLLLFFLALVLIVLSATRTAGMALVLGFGAALLAGYLLARQRLLDYLPGLRNARVRWMLAMVMVGVVGSSPFWGAHLGDYISKGTGNVTVADAYEESRGFLIDEMLNNIDAHPLRGIGFGLASDPSVMVVDRDSVLGLPTGAPIEKGVTYLAVWEEVGLFGFLLVLAWLWMVVRRSARNGGMAALAVCLTALFMNFGESTLFSPGGMGMLSLILIAWAASGGSNQSKEVILG